MGDSEGGHERSAGVPARADYEKLMNDPYFKFLLAKQTRVQTWAFLSAVGTAIVILLGYAGFRFHSAEESIDKYETSLKQWSQEAERAAAEATDLTQQLDQRLAATQEQIDVNLGAARELTEQSRLLSSDLLGTAAQNVESSRDLQQDVFDQHRNLLDSVSRINAQAAANVEHVQGVLDKLEAQRIPNTLEELKQAQETLSRTADSYGTLRDLRQMEDLNNLLLRARTRETLTLRKYNSRSIYLPELEPLAGSVDLQLRAIFSTAGLGKRFHLDWVVEGLDGTKVAFGRDEINAPKKYRNDPADFNVFPMGETGYEYEVEYVNFGALVRDFVMIRVRPADPLSGGSEEGLRVAGDALEAIEPDDSIVTAKESGH